jgi:hypothetical protein
LVGRFEYGHVRGGTRGDPPSDEADLVVLELENRNTREQSSQREDRTPPLVTYPRHSHGRQHLVAERYRITVRVLSDLHRFAFCGGINVLRHGANTRTAFEQGLRRRGPTMHNNLLRNEVIQYTSGKKALAR